jgi:uncharacterized cupredoxin-like copper-binding protein
MTLGLRLYLFGIMLALLVCYAHAQSTNPLPTTRFADIDWSRAEYITVVMSEYKFIPDRLTFRHDMPTRLHLVNNGTEIHDFTAGDFFKTVDLRDPNLIGSSGIGITVEPQQQKDVDLIARLPGHFGLICADHDWAGMTANINVK